MVEYGINYSYWAQDWETDSEELRDRLRRASDIGFDFVELLSNPLLDWSESERRAFKQTAEDLDLSLSFVNVLTPEADISSPDPAIRERGTDRWKASIELVDEMDGPVLAGTVGQWNPDFAVDLEEKAERVDRAVDEWRDIAPVAAEHDVTCAVEVLNRFEQFMLNTAAEARSFVDRVDSPNLHILLDTYHMNIEEDDMRAGIETAGDRLAHLHVGENNRRPPRPDGHIPWEEVAAGLRAVDYDGPVLMEPFVRPGGDIARDIRVWREFDTAKDLDGAAADSLAYLREVMGR
ncbi:TIM barrel protein [Halorubrum sp. CBA1125]|uniref:sugar phosphate isomerase/epimerase family protein n=1 Tax=Halorubrum sp. CBA1125 TaxID=2668072 RepID=UPI0012E88619|nr:sugar phosphate isomerase/epimerase family protein [Halorubrum sp. CBA1125]MUW13818.1 TIM barrel protein [Halorubrum sp. CBA1125]